MSREPEESLRRILDIFAPALPASQRKLGLAALRRELEAHSHPEERRELLERLENLGTSWGYQPAHPLASRLLVALTSLLLPPGSLEGLEHARAARAQASAGRPVVMVGNHLSYGDVHYLKVLLELAGERDFPLLVMAGPKVYQDPFRKLMAMAFETLRMAQPPSRASDGAGVNARALAEITHKVMEDSRAYQDRGRILWFFPEGSRSRSGRMNRFISAAARYLEAEGTHIYPVGFSGTENLMGVKGGRIQAQKITARIGPALSLDTLRAGLTGQSGGRLRRALMDRLGFAVARLLPPGLRGVYGFASPAEPATPAPVETPDPAITGPRASALPGQDDLAPARSWCLTALGPPLE